MSLRQKQIQEVLDEDVMANRAVFMREKKNVATELQQIMPKKQSDMVSEVGIAKGIEALNGLIERKLLAMEKFLSSIGKSSRELTEIESSSDAVSAYNAIVRLYLASGFSRDSQDIVKNQFQNLQSNIDAIVYGYNQTIDFLFSEAEPSKGLFNVIRASCIYRAINDQLFESGANINPRVLTQGDLEIELKDYLGTLSADRQAMLREFQGEVGGPALSIANLPLRNFPVLGDDVEERIRALEVEKGVTIPESTKQALRRIAPLEAEASAKSIGDKLDAQNAAESDIARIRDALANITQSKNQSVAELELKKEELKRMRQALDIAYRDAESRGEEQMLLQDDGYQDGITYFEGLSREIRSLIANQQTLQAQSTQLEGQLSSANERRRAIELTVPGEPQKIFKGKKLEEEEKEKLPVSIESYSTLPKNKDGSVKLSSKEFKRLSRSEQAQIRQVSAASSSASAPMVFRGMPELPFDWSQVSAASAQSPDARARAIARRLTEERAEKGLYSPGDAPPKERPEVFKGMPKIPFDWRQGRGKSHFRQRGLASMRSHYGHQDSGSESDCGCDSDCECDCGCHREQIHYGRNRILGYDDSRNEMYNC